MSLRYELMESTVDICLFSLEDLGYLGLLSYEEAAVAGTLGDKGKAIARDIVVGDVSLTPPARLD